MIVGLDGFRAVNDIWGHAVGDEVLRLTAERLKPFASGPVSVARIAGDEFALVVEGEATQATCASSPTRSARLLSEPFEVDGSTILLGASIGAALYPINAESGQFLFRAADSALSKAKAMGRNALAVFDTEMKQRMRARARRSSAICGRRSSRNEFVVFYQPQLELASGRLRGYEALVRWERPGEGILSPRDFLAVAEETGLIRPIGDWVLRKACEDAASLARFRHGRGEFLARRSSARRTSTRRSPRCSQETGLAARAARDRGAREPVPRAMRPT